MAKSGFINDTMVYIDGLQQPIVFMLWGSFAKKFQPLVTNPKHRVLMANHPSPMSANRGGWFGNKHFSQCNAYLSQEGLSAIDWQIK